MAQLTASRTLVKSSPELWAECSDAASLARHLRAFAEIRITRLEPETAVAWEGEDVRGTVTLEPSGWGTRVVLTAETESAVGQRPGPDAVAARRGSVAGPPEPDRAPGAEDVSEQLADEPSAEPEAIEPGPAPRRGLFGRLFGFWRRAPQPPARAVPPARPETAEVAPAAVLVGALDSLGQAHRRPFSRG